MGIDFQTAKDIAGLLADSITSIALFASFCIFLYALLKKLIFPINEEKKSDFSSTESSFSDFQALIKKI